MNLENTTLLTHKYCMDGSGCGIVFQAAGGLLKNIIFASPPESKSMDKAVESLLRNPLESLIIADISVTEEQAKELEKVYGKNNIILIDHHKTALGLADKFEWCHIDKNNKACGTYLLYEYLCKNRYYKDSRPNILKYKKLATLIDDHDRWQHNYPESSQLIELHYFMGPKRFMKRFLKNPDTDFTESESMILSILREKNEDYIEHKMSKISVHDKVFNGKNYRIGFVAADRLQSELGNRACADMQLNIDAIVMISEFKVSMRSNDLSDLDVSEIAKFYGGGGHKNAAGFLPEKIVNFDIIDLAAKNFLK